LATGYAVSPSRNGSIFKVEGVETPSALVLVRYAP